MLFLLDLCFPLHVKFLAGSHLVAAGLPGVSTFHGNCCMSTCARKTLLHAVLRLSHSNSVPVVSGLESPKILPVASWSWSWSAHSDGL